MLPFVQLLQYRSIHPHIRFAHRCAFPLQAPPRLIYDHELVLIIEGAGTIEAETQSLPFRPGSLLLIPPGAAHRFMDSQAKTYAHIAIHYDWEPRVQQSESLWSWTSPDNVTSKPFASGSLWLPHIAVIPAVPPSIVQQVQHVAELYTMDTPYRQLKLQTAFLSLLLSISQALDRNELPYRLLAQPESAQNETLQAHSAMLDVVRRLHELADQPPISKTDYLQICESKHFSAAYFRRLFKAHTGCSPLQYFNVIRLRKAAELLLNTDQTIKEIAYLCGFEDANYFSKWFRRLEGVTPQEYRNSIIRRTPTR